MVNIIHTHTHTHPVDSPIGAMVKPIIEQFHAQGGPELLKGGIEAVRRRMGPAHGGAAAADARFD